jgi:hypothetical protein
MNNQLKSLILLAATLVVGFALGLFADASLVRGRRDRIGEIRRPPGFVAHMEDVIQPHSDAQRDSIRPILENTARQNGEVMRSANDRLKATLDSMKLSLTPMLDQGQRDRLAREVDRMPPFGPGGRGGGRGRGGPPGEFGRGGPPRGGDRPPPP